MKDKPLVLVMEEAKQEYVNAINKITKEYNLSYYFLNIIFEEIYKEVKNSKDLEIKNLTIQYYKNKPIANLENTENKINENKIKEK